MLHCLQVTWPCAHTHTHSHFTSPVTVSDFIIPKGAGADAGCKPLSPPPKGWRTKPTPTHEKKSQPRGVRGADWEAGPGRAEYTGRRVAS